MARTGDGNYYYIEGAADLERIFALELQGLSATFGHTVSLGIEPRNDTRVEEVLNTLEHNKYGRLLLPNLISAKPIDVVFRVTIPPQRDDSRTEVKVCTFRLAWTAPESDERQVLRVSLRLPIVDEAHGERYRCIQQCGSRWRTKPGYAFARGHRKHESGRLRWGQWDSHRRSRTFTAPPRLARCSSR